jgi:hypothetical protein
VTGRTTTTVVSFAGRSMADGQHDHARTILAPFFPSRFVLVMPKIGIGYDKARLGRGYRHAPALFWFKHGIEMHMPLVHA